MAEKYLRLGKSLKSHEEVGVSIRSNSLVLVTGRPRCGKSVLSKSLANQNHERNILSFDYSGEFGQSKYPNCFSNDSNWAGYLSTMQSLDDLGYPISAYTNKQDWLSLGMGDGAAAITAAIARKRKAHGDDWYEFRRMLAELPSENFRIKKYNEKYGTDLSAAINSESYKSIMKIIDSAAPIFTDTRVRDYNLAILFYKFKYINIDLQLGKGNIFSQQVKARLLTGKVLEKLVPLRFTFEPILIFEEADILCPQLKEGDYFSSADWIRQYILKLGRRAGCMMFFVVQDEKRCDSSLADEYDYKITHEYSPHGWDRGVFSFASRDYYEGRDKFKVLFRAYDSSSQFEHYPQVHKMY